LCVAGGRAEFRPIELRAVPRTLRRPLFFHSLHRSLTPALVPSHCCGLPCLLMSIRIRADKQKIPMELPEGLEVTVPSLQRLL